MRKNTARHWLHATLDLLPVILIPVFMIYSHRHTMTVQTTVDIQYKYQSNEVNSVDDLVIGNVYLTDWVSLYSNDIFDSESNFIVLQLLDNLSVNDITTDEVIAPRQFTPYSYIFLNGDNSAYFYTDLDDDYIVGYSNFGNFANNIVVKIIDFDIPQGDLLVNFLKYTDYNVIESVEVNDETSSVMNVFMDNFNGAIDKYFNMGNVFNMTSVYNWFNTNIFGGTAPVVIYSVWNIVLYEFVMDLIFLLYALFMWFIDVTKRLIEKPLDSIK